MKKIVSTLLTVLLLTACSTSAQEKPSKASSLNLNKISEKLKEVAQKASNEAKEASDDDSEAPVEQKEEIEKDTSQNTNNAQNASNETREPVSNQQSSSNTEVQQPQTQAPVENNTYTCGTSSCTEAEFNKYMEEQLLPQYACQGGSDWNKSCDYLDPSRLEGKPLYATEAETMEASRQNVQNGMGQSMGAKAVRNNGGQIVGYISH